MQILDQIMYTGVATTDNARVGRVRSEDGNFDLPYIPPVPGPWEGQEGTNPEQLLAAAWSICFHGLLGAGSVNATPTQTAAESACPST